MFKVVTYGLAPLLLVFKLSRLSVVTCLVCTIYALWLPAVASAQTIIPDHLAGDAITYLADRPEAVIHQANTKTRWLPGPGKPGYNNGARWLRYTLPTTDKISVLDIKNPWLFKITTYLVRDGQLVTHYQTGSLRPFESRPIISNGFSFPLERGIDTVYLYDEGNSATNYPTELLSSTEFSAKNTLLMGFLGFYYGIALIMMLYNLAIYAGIKDKTYFFFSLYALGLTLFLTTSDGTGARFLWVNLPYLQEPLIGLSWAIGVGFLVEFCLRFLHINLHATGLRMTRTIVQFFIAAIGLWVTFYPSPISYAIQSLASIVIITLLALLGVLISRRGQFEAKVFLVANGAFATGAAVHVLMLFGLIPASSVTHHSIHIGSLVELVLLSLALVNRLRQSESAKWAALDRTQELSQHNRELRTATQRSEEHRQLQKSLQQAQRLKTIGQLAGGFAHDFNNILASIIGFAELAKDKSSLVDPTKQIRYIEEIERSGARGAELVKQLLVYARNVPSQPVEINIAKTLQQAESLLRSSLPATVNISSHVPHQPMLLTIDPEQLQQMLVNLCINASEAMHNRGQIDIHLESTTLPDSTCTSCLAKFSGEYISIKVEDTGTGISGNAAQLFTPFQTSKVVGQGTGLGLSVVHGIVHEHHGHVIAGNRATGGARFTIHLPLHGATAKTRPDSKHILLIENDASVGSYLAALLDEENFMTTVANLPNQALETFVANPDNYDLVITNHLMPHGTGLELAEDIHQLRPDLPIILTTGNVNNIGADELASAGVTNVFEKPLNSEQLLAKIRGLLTA